LYSMHEHEFSTSCIAWFLMVFITLQERSQSEMVKENIFYKPKIVTMKIWTKMVQYPHLFPRSYRLILLKNHLKVIMFRFLHFAEEKYFFSGVFLNDLNRIDLKSDFAYLVDSHNYNCQIENFFSLKINRD
jgi:hypothetical protein